MASSRFAVESSGNVTAGIRALPLVLMMTAGSTSAFGQRLTCYPIRPGDTAARLAQRLTGNAHNRHQPWFQIVKPMTATFIPKSQYGLVQAGWHVCVATEVLRRGSVRLRYHVVPSGPPVLRQTGVVQKQTAIDLSVLLWATFLLVVFSGLALGWVVAGKYIGERQASLDTMRGFGDKFIAEFERPLFRRCAGDTPIKSRLRFRPTRQTLEVLLAPADGRTYPNLFDHRRNVEYDVERVRRLLSDAPFTNGPFYAEGPWVVIPFRLETDTQQEGAP